MDKFWGKLAGMAPRVSLSKTENKLKLLILLSGILLLVVARSATGTLVTMSPQYCLWCHEMTPEYVTWESTSHAKVNCLECHGTETKTGFGLSKASITKMFYQHFTDTYAQPIKMTAKISDRACQQCHAPENRSFTLSGDLIIPHELHGQKGIYCVQCHSGVVHGDIVAREITSIGDPAAWTATMGKKQTRGKYAKPKMNVCMECHTNRKVTTACEACHKTVYLPGNHKLASWEKQHGQLALKDLAYCNRCHSYSLENRQGGQKTVTEYARGNVLCFTCHAKLPSSHDADWRITHKHEAQAHRAGCLVCHDEKQPPTGSKATKTYCLSCHQKAAMGPVPGVNSSVMNNYSSSGASGSAAGKNSGTHPNNWRKIHPTVVKEIGTSGGKCFDCHDRTNCFKCHTQGGKT